MCDQYQPASAVPWLRLAWRPTCSAIEGAGIRTPPALCARFAAAGDLFFGKHNLSIKKHAKRQSTQLILRSRAGSTSLAGDQHCQCQAPMIHLAAGE